MPLSPLALFKKVSPVLAFFMVLHDAQVQLVTATSIQRRASARSVRDQLTTTGRPPKHLRASWPHGERYCLLPTLEPFFRR